MLEYVIQLTPADKSVNQRAGRYVERSAFQAEWRAQLENELQRARIFGILTRIFEEDADEFPHSNLSIFTRNKKISRELNLRERK